MGRPDFFIIGAPKAGTTSLYYYLGQHPNIFMPEFKEPHYFASDLYDGARFIRSEQKYLALFSKSRPEHTRIGEASVWYLYSQAACENIKQFNPDAKIIVMLRDPVELVYSLWSTLLRGFEEDQQDFRIAWELQDERLKGKFIPSGCRRPEQLQYRHLVLLGEQMKKLYTIFPRNQVHICLYDRYKTDTPGEVSNIINFLDLPQYEGIDYTIQNQNYTYPRNGIAHFIYRPPKWAAPVIEGLKDLFISKRHTFAEILKKISGKVHSRPRLSMEFELTLRRYFKNDIILLEKVTGNNFRHWY